jgi:protein gp37
MQNGGIGVGENTKIEWCDHTFSPWVGCTKVSPACDHCYAEGWAKRSGMVEWGPGKSRRRTSAANWKDPLKWNRQAAETGVRPRVFCASLADVFDNEVPDQWRRDLWALIRSTPNLDWLIVTKRIGNATRMLPADWGEGWPHVWLLITVCNQPEADRDIPKLLRTPAQVRGLSLEPLLGSADIVPYIGGRTFLCSCGFKQTESEMLFLGGNNYFCRNCDERCEIHPALDWIIVGGESGPNARPMHPEWARSLRDQCRAAGVKFMFKQWGEWAPPPDTFSRSGFEFHVFEGATTEMVVRVGKKAAGRLLDGVLHDEYPDVLV